MALEQVSPAVTKAVGVLMELNTSQRRRMIAESREKARRDERARIKGAFEQGEARGVKQGEDRLLSLLRSGKSPDEILRMFNAR